MAKREQARPFWSATDEDILQGRVTDIYFHRTMAILEKEGIDRQVAMEIRPHSLPRNWQWAVFCGLNEALALLEKSGGKVSVRAIPEGTIFRAGETVMEIRGRYRDFGALETTLLGLLCQASGVATAAARFRVIAGDRTLMSFGARRMHPAIAPMIDRAAYIGGMDGVAAEESAERLGLSAAGTIPHALILLMGDTVEATKAFHKHISKKIPRIALIDTFSDEKFEAIRVADALGKDLFAIRLDTPFSRRGNFRQILQEVRWELDLRGHKDVKLFVSGGINEESVKELNSVADAYGIGTIISNAPVIDFALDIVEIDGRPIAKRGKESGRKQLWVCGNCGDRRMLPLESPTPRCKTNRKMTPIMIPMMEQGKMLTTEEPVSAIRDWTLAQLSIWGADV
jgi:nicotinate phosphoribosyltransferase